MAKMLSMEELGLEEGYVISLQAYLSSSSMFKKIFSFDLSEDKSFLLLQF